MMTLLKTLRDRSLSLLEGCGWMGPLLVRLTLGLVFAASGWGKLHDLDSVGAFFESLNIPVPYANAVFVSTVELVGGALLMLGLGTRIASVFLAGVMAVAIWTAKLPEIHGLVELAGTLELAYLAVFVWLAVAGAGKASVDFLLSRGHRRTSCAPRAAAV